ncbi:MAG: flagellar biosynthesis protein FlhA [Treponema sp.]|nr:flagellar biosynthesis protein FlhA [Treponema sp.]MCL2237809.1 flagellar biosynthesis protein FlhA [Treponema sp.]
MADAALNPGTVQKSNPLGFFKDSFPAVAVITIVLMLILPMHPVILDALMAINLVLALMILLIVLYVQKPTEFSLFPTMLLVSTVFSLALNVSSTRLILSQGEKFQGNMIKAFSNFVVGSSGNEGLVIGFIIFIIIIAVQLIVITKGATRVSEVAARFTLDGMQVKMMAVENEFSSGAITEEEARIQKKQIQKDADFYGSMDGASKFISGNVKVGVFIIVVEMLGGFIIGSTIHNESNVVSTYIRLAVGDGLVTQLPALLISTAMGIVVTRAASTGVLVDQVTEQILERDAIVYWICAGVLVILSILPGFPWYVLLPMAALVALHAYRTTQKKKQAAGFNEMMSKTQAKEEKPADFPPVVPLDALSLELGYGLVPLVEKEKGAELLERVQGVRRQSAYDLGLVIPKVRIIDNSILEPSEYCFKIKGVDSGRGKIRLGYFLCINPGTVTVEMEGERTVDPAFGLPAIWIDQERRDEAERAGYTVVDPPSIIATHLTEIIRRSAADILGLQDTQAILDTLRKDYPAVVEEALREGKGLRVTEIQKIFHGLLRERVSIRNLVSILEAVADFAPVSKNIWFLTEKARQALASQICHQYADDDRRLRVLTIDPALEQKIIDAKYETASGLLCALDPPTQKAWIQSVVKAVTAVKEKGWMPVVLCSEQARFLVKNSTDREIPDLAVLSVPEIVSGVIPEAVGMIRLESTE